MATEKKYQGIPPLSTIKHLDPNLRKVLLPIWSYVNAQMAATGAKPPVKVDLNINDILSGFINSRTIGDGAVKTLNVLEDNITRSWTYSSETPIGVNYSTGSVLLQGSYPIAFTSPTTISDYDLMIHIFSEFQMGTYNDLADWAKPLLFMLNGINAVVAGSLVWHQSSVANHWYVTNLAGTGSGLPVTIPYIALENSAAGAGVFREVKTGAFTLSAGEFGYGNRESTPLGFNTLYTRLTDSSDPNGKADGYIRPCYIIKLYTSPELRGYNVDGGGTSAIGTVHMSLLHKCNFKDTPFLSNIVIGAGVEYSGLAATLSASSIFVDLIVWERRR